MHQSTESSLTAIKTTRQRLRRQSLLFAGLFCGVLFGLSLVLIAWRVEQVLSTLAQHRTDRVIHQLAEDGESAMRLGLAAGDLAFLQERLERLRREDASVRLALVETSGGTRVAEAGDTALRSLIDARWIARLSGSARAGQARPPTAPLEVRNVPGSILTGTLMLDPAGAPAATVWIVSDPSRLRGQAGQAAQEIVVQAIPLAVISFFLFFALMFGWSRRAAAALQAGQPPRSGIRHWLVLALAALLLAPPAMVWIAREAARPFVTARIETNASAVAATLGGQIERGLQMGIPLASLSGLDALFKERLAAAPELSLLALRTPDGVELARVGGAAATDRSAERTVTVGDSGAHVVAAYSLNYVDRALGDMLLDLVLALIISTVVLRELTRGLWRRSLLYPLVDYRLALAWQWLARLRGRHAEDRAVAAAADRCRSALSAPAGTRAADLSGAFGPQLTRLRLAVFLVALSDELLRPFFTAFASEMQVSSGWLSPSMAAGLPVAAFMSMLALTQIAGPALAQRFDLRKMIMLAATTGALALAGTAMARNVDTLVLLRAISGAAYGMALILVQTAIVRHAPPRQRARNLAEVAAAIVAAGIVGPPFGGMVAGRVGDASAMLACAVCMVCALLIVWRLRLPRLPEVATGARAVTTTAPGWRGYAAVLSNPRAMCVILGSAVPARLVAVTVLVVVVPLYMRALEQPADTAGRVMLLYFLCFSATAAVMAHWSDALGQRTPFIVAGCLVAAVACLQLPLLGGISGMAACCALLGVGQAVQSSPQLALVTEVFEHRAADGGRSATPEQALAAFRLIERLGSIAAPFFTALAIALLGLSGAVAIVGVVLALGAAGVWLGLRGYRGGSLPLSQSS